MIRPSLTFSLFAGEGREAAPGDSGRDRDRVTVAGTGTG